MNEDKPKGKPVHGRPAGRLGEAIHGHPVGRLGGSLLNSDQRAVIEIDFSSLGARIKEERNKLNYTQEYLAEQVGVTSAFIGHIERAERSVSLDTLVKICSALSVTIDYLLSDILPPNGDHIMDEIRSFLKDKTEAQKQAALEIIQTALRYIK